MDAFIARLTEGLHRVGNGIGKEYGRDDMTFHNRHLICQASDQCAPKQAKQAKAGQILRWLE